MASKHRIVLFFALLVGLRVLNIALWVAMPIAVAAAFLIFDRRVATKISLIGMPFIILGIVYENAPLSPLQQRWVAGSIFIGGAILLVVGFVRYMSLIREVAQTVKEIQRMSAEVLADPSRRLP